MVRFARFAAIALPTGHLGRRRSVSGTRPVHHLQLRPLHRRGRYQAWNGRCCRRRETPGVPPAPPAETDGTPYQWLDADAEFEARHVDLRADRDPRPPCDPGCATPSVTPTRWTAAAWWTWPCCIATRRSTSTCAPTISSATPGACSYSSSRVRAGYLGELGEPQAQMPTASLLAQLETDDFSGSEQYPTTAPISPGPGGPGADPLHPQAPGRAAPHRAPQADAGTHTARCDPRSWRIALSCSSPPPWRCTWRGSTRTTTWSSAYRC